MTPPRRRASDAEEHETLHEKLDRVLVVLEGTHDAHGEHHPGLSHRVKRLENYLNWAMGIATAILTTLGAAFGVSHMGGKHL